MHVVISKGKLIGESERRAVLAALAMKGLDQKGYAAKEELSYQRLVRMLSGVEIPSASYAARLNKLLADFRRTMQRQLAAA